VLPNALGSTVATQLMLKYPSLSLLSSHDSQSFLTPLFFFTALPSSSSPPSRVDETHNFRRRYKQSLNKLTSDETHNRIEQKKKKDQNLQNDETHNFLRKHK
jgi:hypothetical protein